jgi:hypothetical protein
MPMMRMGLQAAAVVNGAASLANIFCPMLPRKFVPSTMLTKANSFVNSLDKPSNVADNASVQASVVSGDGGGKAKRGGDLRDFEIFLDKHDSKQGYAGLRRVCNEENGEAIWVTEASVKAMEVEPGASVGEGREGGEVRKGGETSRSSLAIDIKARRMSIKAIAESANKKIDEVQATAIDLLEGQTTIVEMSADTMSLVKKSTSTICKAIFEATEVSTPTRFVILPYELPEPGAELSEEEQTSMLDQADEWMGTVTSMVEEGQGAVADPTSYARCFLGAAFKRKVAEVKSSLVNKTLYLYLVDELTGLPMYDAGGVFPIKIETKSDLVDQYMPMMQVGLQAAAIANGAASLANVFCPFVPSTLVPKSIMDKAEGFLGDLKKPSNVADFGSVQAEVEKGGDGGAKRGGELKDFEKFLEEHDKDRTYSGLKRVCNKETGEAIWVCDDSIGAIRELREVREESTPKKLRKDVKGMEAGEPQPVKKTPKKKKKRFFSW